MEIPAAAGGPGRLMPEGRHEVGSCCRVQPRCYTLGMLTIFLLGVLCAGQPQPGNPTAERTAGLTVKNPSKGPTVPEGFTASVFVQAPDIYSPCSIAAAPDGNVYVAEDEYNSQDENRAEGLAHVKLCIDTDRDGRADRFTIFADGLNSPQGLTFVDHTLYVVHAPYLSALRDDDGDGVADWRKDLVTGLGPKPEGLVHHIPSGIRMGIDGWLYISIGDKGILKATGADGSSVQCIGGGIVRVRPDGTELELFAHGLRNTLDIAVSPRLDCFTRDNTNDGGGWNVRLSQIQNGAEYGYPSLFVNFADEIIPAIGDYGGGSGTGCMWFNEAGWPAGYGNTLYTTDWGVGKVYRHTLTPAGATFTDKAEEFFTGQHPVDIDADGLGNMYICDWGDRGWGDIRREGVTGTIYRVRYTGAGPVEGAPTAEWKDLRSASDEEVLGLLAGQSATARLNASRELIRRGTTSELRKFLGELMESPDAPLESRIASLLTYVQSSVPLEIDREATAHPNSAREALGNALDVPQLSEYVIRAVGDRRNQDLHVWAPGAESADPRVRAQVAITLSRIGTIEDAAHLLPLLTDSDVMVRHAAMQSLRRLGAIEACLAQVSASGATHDEAVAALRVLRGMHDPRVVTGLAELVRSTEARPAIRIEAMKALGQVTYREAEWDGVWWGTRPSTEGPYYSPAAWEGTEAAAAALAAAALNGEEAIRSEALKLIARYRVNECAADLARGAVALNGGTEDIWKVLVALRSDAPEFVEMLRTKAVDGGAPVAERMAAMQALTANAGAGQDALIVNIAATLNAADSPPELAAESAKALARVRDSGQIPSLAAFLTGPSETLRIGAYTALLSMDVQEARDLVTAAFKVNDNDFTQITAALHAIARSPKPVAAAHTQRVLNILTYAPQIMETQPEFVKAALLAAWQIQDPQHAYATSFLMGSGFEQAQCIEVLSRMKTTDIQPKPLQHITATLVNVATAQQSALTPDQRDQAVAAAMHYIADPRTNHEEAVDWLARLRPVAGIMNSFLVLGPLPPIGSQSAFGSVYSVEERPAGPFEALTITTDAGATVIGWNPVTSEDSSGVVDLSGLFQSTDIGVAYLTAIYSASVDCTGTLFVGSDDGVAVWLNGNKIWHNDAYRSLQQYSDQVPVRLRPGPNVFLFKVSNSGGEWGLAARLRVEGNSAPAAESSSGGVRRIKDIPIPEVTAHMVDHPPRPGASRKGMEIFKSLACANCHTVDATEPPKGPYLGDAGKRFTVEHLVQSILQPDAMIAQGFATQEIEYKSIDAAYGESETIRGFVTSESGEAIEVRDLTGAARTIRKADIIKRRDAAGSSMPAKLADNLTEEELSQLIDYLRSLQ